MFSRRHKSSPYHHHALATFGPMVSMMLSLLAWLLLPLAAVGSDSVVIINEIQYNPAGTSEDLEFVELKNQQSVNVDVSGWVLKGIGNFTIPSNTEIPAGGYLVIAKNPTALQSASGFAGALGPYIGSLSNDGEAITLQNHNGREMDRISYNDTYQWSIGADGSGASLSRIPQARIHAESSAWRASDSPGGTPGAANFPTLPAIPIALNEHSGLTVVPFWIELHNYGSSPVDLDGYVISSPLGSHVMSAQTIPAGGFVTLDATTLGFTPAEGDAVFLSTPSQARLVDAARITSTAKSRRPDDPTGEFYTSAAPTPGAANATSPPTDIVINEIMYHRMPHFPTTTELFAEDTSWKYSQSGSEPAGWREVSYNDSAWPSGGGLLGFETNADLKARIQTTLHKRVNDNSSNPRIRTYYFRKSFSYSSATTPSEIEMELTIDDGAVVYLNGTKVYKTPNMPDTGVTYDTLADPAVTDATPVKVTLPGNLLLNGNNVLAVEVHQASVNSSDLVFGMALKATSPYDSNPEEWIELYNRGPSNVDLSDWRISGSVDYSLPSGTSLASGAYLVVARDSATLSAAHPSITILGDYAGKLPNSRGKITLRNADGDLADQVIYADSKPWPAYADAGGSSLELRNPHSDNSRPESWSASDETGRSSWNTYTFTGTANNHIDNAPDNIWQEFAFGILDGGEMLVDDISVTRASSGSDIQQIQNSNFSPGSNTWRLRGNHQRSTVVSDGGNHVLHVKASGNTEYMGNQIETTLSNGQSTVEGATYTVSFRAKWLGGSPLLNSRLYFARLGRTTLIATPTLSGTPGTQNSTYVANTGPTYSRLRHTPAVPSNTQPVIVSVTADDPDNIASMTLHYSVGGGAFNAVSMTAGTDGLYSATIPAQPTASLVQLYLTGTDDLGTSSHFPASGPDSRAMYKVEDFQASGSRQNFRIIMKQSDVTHMHDATNVPSNERIAATVIFNEDEVYYDIRGVRLKGSFVGRNVPHVGFSVRFNSDQCFKGIHKKVAVDRSAGGTEGNPREVILFHTYTQAGGALPSRYDDIIQFIAPRSSETSVAHLRMAGFDNGYLDSVYDNGGDGEMFEFETLRWSTTTSNGSSQGPKLPGNGFEEVSVGEDLAGDKESYRAAYFLMNNRLEDDYTRLIAFNEVMGKTGTAFADEIESVIDIDQWMRVFAFQSLFGVLDVYNSGIEHNMRFYVRPSDGRVLAFPWDWDINFNSTTQDVTGDSPTIAKILAIGKYERLFYGHLHDILQTTYTSSYMDPWIDHYGSVAGLNYSSLKTFVANRRSNVLSQINSDAPFVNFAITTNNGFNFSVSTSSVTLQGTGWIDISNILVNGLPLPSSVTWTGKSTWAMTIPVSPGTNALTLTAMNNQGASVGSDSITITSTTSVAPADGTTLAVSELYYNPPASVDDAAEYIELQNISQTLTIDLANATFSAGIAFTFPQGTTLTPGQRIIVTRDLATFETAFGTGYNIAGAFTGKLDNGGETIALTAADGATIFNFTYDDAAPWPTEADGGSYSLVHILPLSDPADPTSTIINTDHNDPANWRTSTFDSPTPGTGDSVAFSGTITSDTDNDGLNALMEHALGSSDNDSSDGPDKLRVASGNDGRLVTLTTNIAADDVITWLEYSTDLNTWLPLDSGFTPFSHTRQNEKLTQTWRVDAPYTQIFFRAKTGFRVHATP